MGILKILALSAAGIWAGKFVSRLNNQIGRIVVPPISSLAQKAADCGDFYADAFVIELPQRVAYSRLAVTSPQVAQSFFSCKIFTSLEKPLLKSVFGLTEPQLANIFVGQRILLWQVKYLDPSEILLEWQSGHFRGFTWLCVSPDQRFLMLGSSIGYLGYSSRLNANYSPLRSAGIALDHLFNNPYREPFWPRFQTSSTQLCGSIILTVHQFYSRLLLASTLKNLVLEK